jgi:Membrane bound FAD containing D-sorbitol dehydrogenase
MTTRRQALIGVASTALLVAPTVMLAQSGSVTLAEFMELSEILTDNEFSLRDQVGAQYQAALNPAALLKLVNATVRRPNAPQTFNDVLRSGALNDLANARTTQQILTYWYSGLVNGKTADFIEALAWLTLEPNETKPPTEKIGFGEWSRRP